MGQNDGRIIQSKEESKAKAEEKKNQVGIEFVNIRSGERRTAETVEHIAAFFNSSDLGPNARQHQDMGWRIGAETQVELEEIKEDEELVAKIAAGFAVPVEDLADYHILKYISNRRFRKAAAENKNKTSDHETEYQKELEEARKKKVAESGKKEDNGGKA